VARLRRWRYRRRVRWHWRHPRPKVEGLNRYRRITRKVAFLVDPVSKTLLRFAIPKHCKVR
jgi:hypothetical protein